MRDVIGQFGSFGRPVRLLLINQFGINLGFYMLMPYLANYLSAQLLLAGWIVGLVLGVRNFSQQGMFAVGGSLADRFGYKPLIVAGCTLRTVGFALLGLVDSVAVLVVAAAATGLAGALFNPAVRAYLAEDAGERRVEAFAVFNVFYQAGILVGPLVGLALTAADFRLTCLVAATVFAILTVAQARALPARGGRRGEPGGGGLVSGMLTSWRQVLHNRPFMLFTVAMAGSYVLSFQVYLTLPLTIEANAPSPTVEKLAVAAMFAASGLLAVLAQIWVTAWCRRRWSPHSSLTWGVALLGAAFLPVAAASTGPPMLVVASAVLAGAIIAVATMVAYPFEMDMVVTLAGAGRIATHYGIYSTVSGVAVAIGNMLAGGAVDWARSTQMPIVLWLALAALGAACSTAILWLGRRGLFGPAVPTKQATTVTA
ncbi:MFS transporter [Salinispora arenicola]|uniref:MFS transporter n=1 Tax=Salinispora arenicola TaxID=168697 RepID=UPI00207A2DBF|nr:MFS transporter [Salinispora arenicola]MCN0178227.1 MFS transporter [Salinispora arenicola]